MMDLESAQHLMRACLQRVALGHFDGLMDDVLKVTLENPSFEELANAPLCDRFAIYQAVWNRVLTVLRAAYLPEEKQPQEEWVRPEVTLQTVLLCRFLPSPKDRRRLPMGEMHPGVLADLPAALLPGNEMERAAFVARFHDFPPLRRLAWLYLRAVERYQRQWDSLANTFGGSAADTAPRLELPPALREALFLFSADLLRDHPLEELIEHPSLQKHREALERLKAKTAESTLELEGTSVCACCGMPATDLRAPPHLSAYRLVLNEPELADAIGFTYFTEVEAAFKQQVIDAVIRYTESLNRVDHPECLLMVEGESEEVSLPILALRLDRPLAPKKIFVHNAGSKEKLEIAFRDVRSKYPHQGVVMLLDSDAKREKNNIERMSRDQKNLYHLEFIETGTYEDLFPRPLTIEILNQMYPEGELLEATDFEEGRSFLDAVKVLLHEKKKAAFDKKRFAREMALKIPAEEIPQQLRDLIEKAHLIADARRPLRMKRTGGDERSGTSVPSNG
jgi:hypothetical protein